MEIRNSIYSPAFVGRKELQTNLNNQIETFKKTLSQENNIEKLKDIQKEFETIKKEANANIDKEIKENTFKGKLDKYLEKSVKWLMDKMQPKKIIRKNTAGRYKDFSSAVVSAVLIGNTLKEVVGTTLYTTQAMTNPDLPKEKRKFIGLYDLFVGIVSTTVSLIFGIGLQDAIKKGYEKALKPVKSAPKYVAVLAGLSGFTSFALQTIVGKRIIAPAIGTPLAGRYKEYLMAKDAAKKAKNGETSQPVENLPTTKAGFIDLETYLKQASSKK